MSSNIFFKKKNIKLSQLFPKEKLNLNFQVNDIKPLDKAKKNEITFFDSAKYKDIAEKTKASACITTQKILHYLPKNIKIIIVKNVLFELARITKLIYPSADIDLPDVFLKKPNKSNFKKVRFGNNVLIGKNVKIGKNSIIGSNSIIESNVELGRECVIGSSVVIKNSIVGKNVVIQDGCKIGQKGFGFIPLDEKNIKFPHIGKVIIKDHVEIASNCTLDRGSIDDTVIGKNTYLDNQVHVAHNVQIGSNCMIAGQVGFAGSSKIGNNVSIGGQAGISGHLRIGNNVKIGGGSGVVKNIEDNQTVMGYPALPLKEFLKKNNNKDE
jgi:UDP-3-O-[3-hydroxymyristoyl] glucosamine N-acyltransferase